MINIVHGIPKGGSGQPALAIDVNTGKLYYSGGPVTGWTEITASADAGGVPADPSGSVQFNNSGAFGGSANLTFDPTFTPVPDSGALHLINGASGVLNGIPGELAVEQAINLPATGIDSIQFGALINAPSDSDAFIGGMGGTLRVMGAGHLTNLFSAAQGIEMDYVGNGTADIIQGLIANAFLESQAPVGQEGNGTVTLLIGAYHEVANYSLGSGHVGKQAAVYIDSPLDNDGRVGPGTPVTDHNYGLLIKDQSLCRAADTWGVYVEPGTNGVVRSFFGGPVILGAEAGPQLLTGSGAPSSTPPNGSIYLDTSAGTAYLRVGAAWKTITHS